MKVLFACGGTAGHINPAIAVATELRRRVPDCEILFVGNPDGMEAPLAGDPAPSDMEQHQAECKKRLSAGNGACPCQ